MKPALKNKLLRPLWLRRFIRKIFATGDTVRRVVQKPTIDAFLPKTGKQVLDVGAGRGMYTFDSLQERFQRVVSVDICTDHLTYLMTYKRRFALDNIFLVQASAEALPFKMGAFQSVLCTEVIEHLPDDRAGIRELVRMLSPQGTLVLSVPVPPAPRRDGAHVHEGYTYKQLEELLGVCALTIADKEYCLLILSRGVLHVIAFFEQHIGFPPPILFLCYLERWLFRWRKEELKPYDIILKGIKTKEDHT